MQYVSMKNKLFIGIIILFATISVVGNVYFFKIQSLDIQKENTQKKEAPSSNNETLITIGKNEIVVSPTSVTINEWFESHNPLSLIIDKKNYPNLFSPANEFARIHVEEMKAGKNLDISLIRISRQIPDHGSLADSYYVVFDPVIGKVVDTGWNHFFGTVYLYDSCTSCALPLLEFTTYDQKQEKFVLTNNEHKKEFQALLQEYTDLQKKQTCRIQGIDMTLADAVKKAKDDDKCADRLLGINNNKPSDGFITIGQYRSILENIQKVINGENIKVFERI